MRFVRGMKHRLENAGDEPLRDYPDKRGDLVIFMLDNTTYPT